MQNKYLDLSDKSLDFLQPIAKYVENDPPSEPYLQQKKAHHLPICRKASPFRAGM